MKFLVKAITPFAGIAGRQITMRNALHNKPQAVTIGACVTHSLRNLLELKGILGSLFSHMVQMVLKTGMGFLATGS